MRKRMFTVVLAVILAMAMTFPALAYTSFPGGPPRVPVSQWVTLEGTISFSEAGTPHFELKDGAGQSYILTGPYQFEKFVNKRVKAAGFASDGANIYQGKMLKVVTIREVDNVSIPEKPPVVAPSPKIPPALLKMAQALDLQVTYKDGKLTVVNTANGKSVTIPLGEMFK